VNAFFILKYIFLRLFFPKSLTTLEYKLFRKLNKARKSYSLPKLFFQKDLRAVARKHSRDMARKDYFSHETLLGKSPKDRYVASKVSDVVAGENLAKVGGYPHPVLVAHDGLMNSPGHRANILSKAYNCVGIGAAISAEKVYYFTQNFSYRLVALRNFPEAVRFRNTIKIKGKAIVSGINVVILKVKDSSGRYIYDKGYKLQQNSKFEFVVTFPVSGEYEFEVYAGSNTLRMTNHFKIHKKVFFW